jgi:GNAT superfamily N-acetyltransferase
MRAGVELRGVVPADAADVALLLGQLGHAMPAHRAAERLEQLARDPAATVLVATDADGAVIGLVAVTRTAMLQLPHPVGRVTALVVDDRARRRGIGRMLIKAAAQAARAAGCDVLEVTTGGPDAEAETFCRALGFGPAGLRLTRALRKRASEA